MKYLLQIFIITTVFIMVSCSSGGGDSAPAGTSITIEGVWAISETAKPSNCAVPAPPQNFNLIVSQEGNSVTVVDEEANSFNATLNGYTLSWTGSYSDTAPDGTPGTTTLTSMVSTIDASCNSLTGTANWTWNATDGSGYSCTGTTTFTGSRTPASGCGTTDPTDPTVPADPTGIWDGTFTEDGINYDLGGIVEGNQLRLVTGSLFSVSSGTLSISGSSFTTTTTDYDNFGGPTGTGNISATFTPKATMSGTFTDSDGSSGTFSLTYDSDTAKGSSLATITGTWFGSRLQFMIDSAGTLTGADTFSCVYNGSVSIIDPAVNIYGLSVTISSCGAADGSYTGYASITDEAGGANNGLGVIFNNSGGAAADYLSKF